MGHRTHSPATVGGKFQLVELLGRGDAVDIYRGHHLSIGRAVEVHLLSDHLEPSSEAAARVLRRARLVGSVSHRHLQGVVDTGHDEAGRPYVVYEAARGRTLRDLLDRHPGGLPDDRAARIALQAVGAMGTLHEAGVVLRTFSPSQLRVEEVGPQDEIVKITLPDEAAFLIDGGALPIAQSTAYVAPELIRADHGLDARADVFSVGVMFREMLTGSVSGFPVGDTAARAVQRACALELDERFADCAGLMQALSLLVPGQGRAVRDETAVPSDPLHADLQYLGLRRRSGHGMEKVALGTTRVRLIPVLLVIEAVFRRFGQRAWDELSQMVPGLESLLPGSGDTTKNLRLGVVVQVFERLMLAVDDLGGTGDLSLIVELGESIAPRGVDRLLSPAPSSPQGWVEGFPRLWHALCRQGTPHVRRRMEGKAGSAQLKVTGQMAPSLELTGMTAGLLRGGLRACGADDVEVRLLGAQAVGDPCDFYEVSWSA